jgi:hypothetical protein
MKNKIASFVSLLLIGSSPVYAGEDELFRVIYRDRDGTFIIYQDTDTGCQYIGYKHGRERTLTPRIHPLNGKPWCNALKPNVDLQDKERLK